MSATYTLIAYKPNSDDYCQGCHMESYSSDFDLALGLSEEELIERIASFHGRILGSSEVGYEIHILEGGVPQDLERVSEITRKAEELGKVYLENAKKLAAEREAEERAKRAAEDRESERKQLARLLERHPDMKGTS